MTFEKKAILNSFTADFLAVLLIISYTALTLGIKTEVLIELIMYIFPIVCFVQFIIAPFADHFVYRNISNRLVTFKKGTLSLDDRTSLLEDLQQYPFIGLVLTSGFFVITTLGATLFVFSRLELESYVKYAILIQWLSGSYFAGLFAYSYISRICTSYSIEINSAGINKQYIYSKKYFGQGLFSKMFMFVYMPIFLTTCMILFMFLINLISPNKTADTAKIILPTIGTFYIQMPILRVLSSAVLNTIIMIVLIMIFYTSFHKKNNESVKILQKIRKSDIMESNAIHTDLSDELSYNIFLINDFIGELRSMISNSIEIGQMITQSSLSLSQISTETESTSEEQNKQTQEIICTMEDCHAMSIEIDATAKLVTECADETDQNIVSCNSLMEQNIQNMRYIESSNEATLAGIKSLNKKISSIWEIINIINSLADQTKIIAFNTELESSNVSEEEENFLNVALETRRLANNIADSIKEIKDYIKEIEKAENELLNYSVSNTHEITKGMTLSCELEENFGNINALSERNTDAANEIRNMLENQSESFTQIRSTLEEIGKGIENFAISTRTLVQASKSLNRNSDKLGHLNSNNGDDNE